MKIDTTDSRQSKYIVGILIITVFAVCVGIAFGYGGNFKVKQDDNYLLNSSFPNLIEDSSGNKQIVTVAQGIDVFDVDTAEGSIMGDAENLPDWSEVPLCIDDALLAEYWLNVKVVGGYKPYGDWYIDLFQYREGADIDKTDKDFIGRINLVWSIDVVECCYTIYHITFDVVGDCIHVDSNHFPDFPAGWDLIKDVECTPDLNKKVDFKVRTNWYGCGLPEQRFELILSQKIVFPESPNSRM